jgi:hypothetical protein
MLKINRKKESELLNEIALYRLEFQRGLEEDLRREREEHRKGGEVFFNGVWVPGNRIAEVQARLARRIRETYRESVILIAVMLLVTLGFWMLFKKLFL